VSNRKRALQADADAVRDDLLIAAGGLTLDAASAEVDALEISSIDAEIRDLGERQTEMQSNREKQVLALNAAEQQLQGMQGGDATALAEGRRQEAIAAMAIAAERYIKLRIAGRLLAWSVNKFREERQDPLLRLAGERFATLTHGSFAKLAIDYEDEAPVIKGQRSDGNLVGVEGMSDGSRDQLYLALRLAAIELSLVQARELPFIADDLFINFDENRVAGGFKALRSLAENTQVIYLTHHRHVVDVARQVYGEAVNVIEL